MKLLLTSDWHITNKQPDWLDNDVFEMQKQYFEWFESTGADFILIAGDVFERPTGTTSFVNWCFDNLPDNILAIPGNHDLPFRNPLMGIEKSLFLSMVKGKKFVVGSDEFLKGNRFAVYDDNSRVVFHGIPFGAVDYEVEPVENAVNVLMVHEQVFKDSVPHWSNGVTGKDLGMKYKGFDVIVSGDIHQSFIIRHVKTGRIVCNPGGFDYTSDEDVKRNVYLYDTETREVEVLEVPIFQKFSYKVEKVGYLDDEKIDLFVKYIMEGEVDTVDFKKEIVKVAKSEIVEEGVRNKLLEVANEIN